MKKINFILFIISTIGIILAFSLFCKEGYAIKINSKNKDLVSNALNGKIEKIDDVTKIILGQGWHSGELTIYYSFGKTDTFYITGGVLNSEDLENYIRDNGQNLDDIAYILIGVSSIIILYLLIYRYVNKS